MDARNQKENKNKRTRTGVKTVAEREGERGPSGRGEETSHWEEMRPRSEKRLLFLLLGVSMAVWPHKFEDRGAGEAICDVK